MKSKIFAVAAILILMFAVVPSFSWTPPPFIPPSFENVQYIEPQDKTFEGPCTESRRFNATHNIYNVTDLYAYDIIISFDTTYLELERWWLNIPAGWAVDTYRVLINRTEQSPPAPPTMYYHFAVTRLGNVSGFTGSMTLAVLQFHIVYEPCWPDCVTTKIGIVQCKMSNACGLPIIGPAYDGFITIKSSKPNIEILFSKDPKVFNITADKTAFGWINCTWLSAYVWVSNVTKFYGMSIDVYFDPTLLNTDIQHVFINEEWFTWPWTKFKMSVICQPSPPIGVVEVEIERPNEEEKWLKGTNWLIRIDFHVKCVMNMTHCDPPRLPINASCDVTADWALARLWMCGREYKAEPAWPGYPYNFTISWSTYYWRPIRYDFSQNGHVGVEDIVIILAHYGHCACFCPFDLNGDHWVDLYDVVKVAKAYCNSTPPTAP